MKLYAILATLCISTAALPALNTEHFLTTNDPDYVLDTLAGLETQKNNHQYMLLYSLRNQAARLTDNSIMPIAELLKLNKNTTATTTYYNTLIKQQEFQALQEKIYQLSGKKNVIDRALNATKTASERTAIIALLLETIMNALSVPEKELVSTAAQRLATFEKELNKLTSSEAVNDAVMALDLDQDTIVGYLKKISEKAQQNNQEPTKQPTAPAHKAEPARSTPPSGMAINIKSCFTGNDSYIFDALYSLEEQKNAYYFFILYTLRNQESNLTNNKLFSVKEVLPYKYDDPLSQADFHRLIKYYTTLSEQKEFQALQKKIDQLIGGKNSMRMLLQTSTETVHEQAALLALLFEIITQILSSSEEELMLTAKQLLTTFKTDLREVLASTSATDNAFMILSRDPNSAIGYLKKLSEMAPQTHTAEQKKESTVPASTTPAVNTASESSHKKEPSLPGKLPNTAPFFTFPKGLNIKDFLASNDTGPHPEYDSVRDYLESLEKQKNAALYMTLYILRNQAADLTNHEILPVEELIKLKQSTFVPHYYTTLIQQKEFQLLQKKIDQLIGNKNTLKNILKTTVTEYKHTYVIALFLEIIITILSHSEEELSLIAKQQLATFKTKLNNELGSVSATNDVFKALSLDKNNAIGYLIQLSEKEVPQKKSEVAPSVATPKKEEFPVKKPKESNKKQQANTTISSN